MIYCLLTCFPAFQSGSEEETFVFPNGNGSEHSKGQTSSDSDAEAATLSDRSTQRTQEFGHRWPTEKSASFPETTSTPWKGIAIKQLT